nr:MAG TPA: hypothetical protein [Caudoviricetes sp.]
MHNILFLFLCIFPVLTLYTYSGIIMPDKGK